MARLPARVGSATSHARSISGPRHSGLVLAPLPVDRFCSGHLVWVQQVCTCGGPYPTSPSPFLPHRRQHRAAVSSAPTSTCHTRAGSHLILAKRSRLLHGDEVSGVHQPRGGCHPHSDFPSCHPIGHMRYAEAPSAGNSSRGCSINQSPQKRLGAPTAIAAIAAAVQWPRGGMSTRAVAVVAWGHIECCCTRDWAFCAAASPLRAFLVVFSLNPPDAHMSCSAKPPVSLRIRSLCHIAMGFGKLSLACTSPSMPDRRVAE